MKINLYLASMSVILSSCTNEDGESLLVQSLVLALFILIIAIYVLRPVFLWYWKVDKILSELKLQNEILRKAFESQLLDYEKKHLAQIEDNGIEAEKHIVYSIPKGLSENVIKEIKTMALQINKSQIVAYKAPYVDIWDIPEYEKNGKAWIIVAKYSESVDQ